MSDNLPPLSGYNQARAIKVRKAYLRYLNTFAFTTQCVSRLDIGLHINSMEEQLQRLFTLSEKYQLEDMIYEKYLEPKAPTYSPKGFYIKPNCIGYGVYAIDMFKKTEQWLAITNRIQCFELLIRCIIYDFKKSPEFKAFLKSIPYRPKIIEHHAPY